MSQATTTSAATRVSIRDGLLSQPLNDLNQVRLIGSRCTSCGETTLGKSTVCPNCGKGTVVDMPLDQRGTLWTYTIVRHRPPGDYKGPDPFVPFAMGLVELPDGLRVLAPIECELERLKIGLELQLRCFVRPGSSNPEVVTFVFAPIA